MPHMVGRRTAVAGIAGSAASLLLTDVARAAPRAPGDADASLDAALADFAEAVLRIDPMTATSLGLDKGARAGLRGEMGIGGPAGQAALLQQIGALRTRLTAIDAAKLSPASALRLGVANYAALRGEEAAGFGYGGGPGDGFFGRAVPYTLSQLNGALTSIPAFLGSDQPIERRSDAEAYLARMAGLTKILDQESEKLSGEAAKGVVPPSFVAATALAQLKAFRAIAARDQPMAKGLADRTRTAAISGNWHDRATRIVDQAIYPALDRQIAAFERSIDRARIAPGVDQLPDGDAYYAFALQLGTTTAISASEVHRIGLDQNAEIKSRIDALLKSQGLNRGSVGERVAALTHDPAQLFPNDDTGRADLLAFIRGRIAACRAFQPRFSHLPLKAPVDVRRVPPDIEDGQPLGYVYFASLDGARPATYYVNLKSVDLWSQYQLASLSAHEAIPGHAWQGAYVAEMGGELPLISSMITFGAFNEGWALYAEQMMDELGLYQDDPFGRIGYLQAVQMRAGRLVVDTGLHAQGWSRDRAIDFLAGETGKSRPSITNEIDRYCVWPGQACGYKIGHNVIVGERARAKAALGDRFDLAAFNDALIETGGVPLALLPEIVDRFLARSGKA